MDIPEGRIRALENGQLARVCPVCKAVIEEEMREVVVVVAPDGTPSYGVEITSSHYPEHYEKEHFDE